MNTFDLILFSLKKGTFSFDFVNLIELPFFTCFYIFFVRNLDNSLNLLIQEYNLFRSIFISMNAKLFFLDLNFFLFRMAILWAIVVKLLIINRVIVNLLIRNTTFCYCIVTCFTLKLYSIMVMLPWCLTGF